MKAIEDVLARTLTPQAPNQLDLTMGVLVIFHQSQCV